MCVSCSFSPSVPLNLIACVCTELVVAVNTVTVVFRTVIIWTALKLLWTSFVRARYLQGTCCIKSSMFDVCLPLYHYFFIVNSHGTRFYSYEIFVSGFDIAINFLSIFFSYLFMYVKLKFALWVYLVFS